jgi:glycosyltransferase involved in cell wall biosynthesis
MRSMRPFQMWRSSTLRTGISMIDFVIAPSAFMASVLKRRLGIEAVVIPNFAPRPSIEGSHKGSARYFLFTSVLEKHKGLDLLLDAYRNGDVMSGLHIAGRGSLEGLVRERERETGGKIRYVGFLDRDELLSEIGSALAVVLPSQCPESSGLSCIEALALGTPIIVSERGGLPELLDDPQSGLVCGPSAGEISEVLQRMERNPVLRDQLSKNAFLRYERNHTPEHYVDAYMSRVEGIVHAS